ncbi:hypothetical protein EDC04DRAFT_2604160 [Pisolithus marmoratus]|nr:hypothetical protein EDC04DRAFT_2604160 [Pisolithus marmoratus]
MPWSVKQLQIDKQSSKSFVTFSNLSNSKLLTKSWKISSANVQSNMSMVPKLCSQNTKPHTTKHMQFTFVDQLYPAAPNKDLCPPTIVASLPSSPISIPHIDHTHELWPTIKLPLDKLLDSCNGETNSACSVLDTNLNTTAWQVVDIQSMVEDGIADQEWLDEQVHTLKASDKSQCTANEVVESQDSPEWSTEHEILLASVGNSFNRPDEVEVGDRNDDAPSSGYVDSLGVKKTLLADSRCQYTDVRVWPFILRSLSQTVPFGMIHKDKRLSK